jgi:hypothetical protein
MRQPPSTKFASLYSRFPSPINITDCGSRCAPYNDAGIPFCCDLRYTIPTAYQAEWDYLRSNTDLWKLWQSDDPAVNSELHDQTPDGQVLIACKGHQYCQRQFRSISCRSFPFFPYIDSKDEFIGLSYYWEYEDLCWVISNLQVVSTVFIEECIMTFEDLFDVDAYDRENYGHFSAQMRQNFAKMNRSIPLFHRNGFEYKISPRSERLRRFPIERFPKFGLYKIAAELSFSDEL